MEERIPVFGEPFEHGQEVPVCALQDLALVNMGAEILTIYPELDRAPRSGVGRIRAGATVRIGHEGEADGERIRTPGEALPTYRHFSRRLIACRMVLRSTLSAATHRATRAGGTSSQSTGYPCHLSGWCCWA